MHRDRKFKGSKAGMGLILGIVLLFLAVFLVSAAVRQIRSGSHWVSVVVSICGVVLFGATGVCLIISEIRQKGKK